MRVSRVLRVFLHATIACGTELLDVPWHQDSVATFVWESTYLHNPKWISYEIRFKVPATHACPRYSLLNASDILRRNIVGYLCSTWRRRTWILEPSLVWVAIRSEWWQTSLSSLTPASGLLARGAILAGILSRQYYGLWHSPPRLKLSGWSHVEKNLSG